MPPPIDYEGFKQAVRDLQESIEKAERKAGLQPDTHAWMVWEVLLTQRVVGRATFADMPPEDQEEVVGEVRRLNSDTRNGRYDKPASLPSLRRDEKIQGSKRWEYSRVLLVVLVSDILHIARGDGARPIYAPNSPELQWRNQVLHYANAVRWLNMSWKDQLELLDGLVAVRDRMKDENGGRAAGLGRLFAILHRLAAEFPVLSTFFQTIAAPSVMAPPPIIPSQHTPPLRRPSSHQSAATSLVQALNRLQVVLSEKQSPSEAHHFMQTLKSELQSRRRNSWQPEDQAAARDQVVGLTSKIEHETTGLPTRRPLLRPQSTGDTTAGRGSARAQHASAHPSIRSHTQFPLGGPAQPPSSVVLQPPFYAPNQPLFHAPYPQAYPLPVPAPVHPGTQPPPAFHNQLHLPPHEQVPHPTQHSAPFSEPSHMAVPPSPAHRPQVPIDTLAGAIYNLETTLQRERIPNRSNFLITWRHASVDQDSWTTGDQDAVIRELNAVARRATLNPKEPLPMQSSGRDPLWQAVLEANYNADPPSPSGLHKAHFRSLGAPHLSYRQARVYRTPATMSSF